MFTSRLLASLRNTAVGLLVGAAALASAQAAVVTVSASQSSVQLGGSFSLYFDISGLTTTTSLGTFDLNVNFDGAVLAFSGASFDDNITGQNQLDLPEPASVFPFSGDAQDLGSVVDAYGVSGNSTAKLDDEQADNFRFLTLQFTALALSTGTTLGVDLADLNLIFWDAGFNDLPYSFGSSQATIVITDPTGGGTVPEPGALPLALLALAGAALAGQRRRGAASRAVSAYAH